MSHREDAFKLQGELTPHGKNLQDEIFKKVEYRDYSISIVNGIDVGIRSTIARE